MRGGGEAETGSGPAGTTGVVEVSVAGVAAATDWERVTGGVLRAGGELTSTAGCAVVTGGVTEGGE